MPYRVALIHATALAVGPITDAFRQAWPEATLMNVLDDSLSKDLQVCGQLTPAMEQRFVDLGNYVLSTGAQAILFTCSAFGPAIDRVRGVSGVPTLKPNEPMFIEALRLAAVGGHKVGLITTFAPAAASMKEELLAEAHRQGLVIQLHEVCVPEAIDALSRQDEQTHDQLIAQAAQRLPGCDVVMLGQFSMARAEPVVSSVLSCPVLTSPSAAVQAVRKHLTQP